MADGFDPETGEVYETPHSTHRWSQPADQVFAALAKAQAEIGNAARDNTNPHFRSRYADLTSVKEACWKALTAAGIAPVQMPINGAGGNIGVVTLFAHASGQWIESTVFVAPAKFDAQGVGSVITYLRRYALAAMAGVAPDDDDGEAAVARPADARTPEAAGKTPQEVMQVGRSSERRPNIRTPQPATAEADKGRQAYLNLRNLIDGSTSEANLGGLIGGQEWIRVQTLVAEAKVKEGHSEDDAAEMALTIMKELSRRAEKRRAALLDEPGNLVDYEV